MRVLFKYHTIVFPTELQQKAGKAIVTTLLLFFHLRVIVINNYDNLQQL